MHGLKNSFIKTMPTMMCEARPGPYSRGGSTGMSLFEQQRLEQEIAAANCDYERRQALIREEGLAKENAKLKEELTKKSGGKKSLAQQLGFRK